MNGIARIVPYLVVAVLAVLVVRRRLSQRTEAPNQRAVPDPRAWQPKRAPGGITALLERVGGDVGLVAAREVRARVRGRVFRVGTLLILTGVAAAIVIPVLARGKAHPQQVGVVGTLSAQLRAAVTADAASAGTTVRLIPEPNDQAARADLSSGHLDLAIVDAGSIIVDKAIAPGASTATARLVSDLASTLGVARAFAAAGLTPAQAGQVAGARPVPVTSLHPAGISTTARAASLAGLILVVIMLTQYNTWTLTGVMEEKSSRVVEVLLAAVRPVQLLAGKVLGIGLVVFAQAAVIVALAIGLAKATGSALLHGSTPLALVSTLLWLVLGYAFYSWVYAAAGATAERQDQAQTLAFPLSLPIFFGYIMALMAISSGSPSVFFHVLAYLPPTAPFAMPVLVSLGAVTWWEFTASVLISVLCTFGVARLAASIYRRSILRTGRRVTIRELVSGTAA